MRPVIQQGQGGRTQGQNPALHVPVVGWPRRGACRQRASPPLPCGKRAHLRRCMSPSAAFDALLKAVGSDFAGRLVKGDGELVTGLFSAATRVISRDRPPRGALARPQRSAARHRRGGGLRRADRDAWDGARRRARPGGAGPWGRAPARPGAGARRRAGHPHAARASLARAAAPQ